MSWADEVCFALHRMSRHRTIAYVWHQIHVNTGQRHRILQKWHSHKWMWFHHLFQLHLLLLWKEFSSTWLNNYHSDFYTVPLHFVQIRYSNTGTRYVSCYQLHAVCCPTSRYISLKRVLEITIVKGQVICRDRWISVYPFCLLGYLTSFFTISILPRRRNSKITFP